MTGHKKIIESLYEYIRAERGELGEDARMRIEEHLASCAACRAELEELRSTLEIVDRATGDSSKELADTYWRNFAIQVDQRIAEALPKRTRRTLLELLGFAGVGGYRTSQIAIGFAAAMLLVACSVGVWFQLRPQAQAPLSAENAMQEESPGLPQTPVRLVSNDTTNEQMLQYVRKTKMILVGITNMKADGEDVDISSEQQRSKALLQQARYLKSQAIDDRSAKLIDELQMILTELANMKDQGNAPNVEILRSGVHHENLLFKIRMEEQKYARAEKTGPARKNKITKHEPKRTYEDTI